jgi:hypothetical protein
MEHIQAFCERIWNMLDSVGQFSPQNGQLERMGCSEQFPEKTQRKGAKIAKERRGNGEKSKKDYCFSFIDFIIPGTGFSPYMLQVLQLQLQTPALPGVSSKRTGEGSKRRGLGGLGSTTLSGGEG